VLFHLILDLGEGCAGILFVELAAGSTTHSDRADRDSPWKGVLPHPVNRAAMVTWWSRGSAVGSNTTNRLPNFSRG
jgi:hypothetical protein